MTYRDVREIVISYVERKTETSSHPVPMDIGNTEEDTADVDWSSWGGPRIPCWRAPLIKAMWRVGAANTRRGTWEKRTPRGPGIGPNGRISNTYTQDTTSKHKKTSTQDTRKGRSATQPDFKRGKRHVQHHMGFRGSKKGDGRSHGPVCTGRRCLAKAKTDKDAGNVGTTTDGMLSLGLPKACRNTPRVEPQPLALGKAPRRAGGARCRLAAAPAYAPIARHNGWPIAPAHARKPDKPKRINITLSPNHPMPEQAKTMAPKMCEGHASQLTRCGRRRKPDENPTKN